MGLQVSPAAHRDEFERMYRAHRDPILAYLMRRTSDAGAAADLLADVFLVAWRRREVLPPVDEQRLWLFGVARNTLLSYHRRRRRDARLGEQLAQALATAQGRNPHDVSDDRVLTALDSLSVRDRELLTLAVWEDLSTDEIATVTGLKPTAVRVALHRARQRLREALTVAEVRERVCRR